jgi:putative ABC transport system substrate-binding protein
VISKRGRAFRGGTARLPRPLGRRVWALLVILGFLAGTGCAPGPPAPIIVLASPDSPRMRQAIAGLETRLGPGPLEVVWASESAVEAREQMRRLRGRHPRLLVVLGTPALMTVAPEEKSLPVVFALVGNPYFTGAAYDAKNPEDHQENITGIASPPPVRAALEKGARLLGPRAWGLLYDPDDGVAVELKERFLKESRDLGIEPLTAASTDAAGDRRGLEALRARGARVFYLPPAPSAARYGPLLLAWGREGKAAVVSSLPEADHKGAVLWVALDYRALGEEAGALARRILAGEEPARIPIMESSPLMIEVDETLVRRWIGYP